MSETTPNEETPETESTPPETENINPALEPEFQPKPEPTYENPKFGSDPARKVIHGSNPARGPLPQQVYEQERAKKQPDPKPDPVADFSDKMPHPNVHPDLGTGPKGMNHGSSIANDDPEVPVIDVTAAPGDKGEAPHNVAFRSAPVEIPNPNLPSADGSGASAGTRKPYLQDGGGQEAPTEKPEGDPVPEKPEGVTATVDGSASTHVIEPHTDPANSFSPADTNKDGFVDEAEKREWERLLAEEKAQNAAGNTDKVTEAGPSAETVEQVKKNEADAQHQPTDPLLPAVNIVSPGVDPVPAMNVPTDRQGESAESKEEKAPAVPPGKVLPTSSKPLDPVTGMPQGVVRSSEPTPDGFPSKLGS